jgi:flavin-dependent dehydrogenase
MTARRNTLATAAVGVIAVAFLVKRLRASRRPSFLRLPPKGSPVPKGENFAEVAVVGAGPSGSVTAFYIKRQNPNLRVLMLEKETFPREKFCGEAWCTPALRILDDMGILKKLEDSGVVHDTATGGFRTPDGGGFVDMSGDRSTSKKSAARTCSIPRIVADHVICQRAQEIGAVLAEGCEVSSACFDPVTELWTITTSKDEKFFSRVLVIADGSNSFLARKMGLITSEPTGFCTRQYLKAGTHSVQADGVLYYPTDLLPGYMALFKHFNGDCYFGTYLLPGGKYGQ